MCETNKEMNEQLPEKEEVTAAAEPQAPKTEEEAPAAELEAPKTEEMESVPAEGEEPKAEEPTEEKSAPSETAAEETAAENPAADEAAPSETEEVPEAAPAPEKKKYTLPTVDLPEPCPLPAEMTGEAVKKTFNKNLLWLLLIPVAAGAIYGGVWYKKSVDYYSKHFYPDTTIGDMKIGGMTVGEVEKKLKASLADYKMTIHQQAGDVEITAEDIDRHYVLKDSDGESIVQEMMDSQEPWKWCFKEKDDYEYDEPEIVCDQAAVETLIDQLDCVSPKEVKGATDAYVQYDEENHVYSVAADVPGNVVERSVASDAVYNALADWSEEATIPEDAYEQAQVKGDDKALNDFVNEVEKYLSAEITLQDGDVTVVVDRDVIADFLDVDMENLTVELVEKRVQSYINKALDGAFDTVGRERTVTTSLSGTFTVKGGTYGKVVYTLEELPKLVEEIRNGETVTRTPTYRQNEKGEANDGIGDTFVDVNLSKQTLLFIKDGKEYMTSQFVSGCTNKKRGTPTGIYKVEIKNTEYTMKKYNAFVHYWMNFYSAVGVGFHDATWRGKFGGNIYKSNGSHGCINMPLSKAKELYNAIDFGTPVLVHY